ncbi:ATP-dependent DNA helicase PIF1, partial [Phenoliferia sp. Uapishka_3]
MPDPPPIRRSARPRTNAAELTERRFLENAATPVAQNATGVRRTPENSQHSANARQARRARAAAQAPPPAVPLPPPPPLKWWDKFPPPPSDVNLPPYHNFRWLETPCATCGVYLLDQESKGWCCLNGKVVVPRLPPLPPVLQAIPEPLKSTISRRLNSSFSMSALGISGQFAKLPPGPFALAITGRAYHRLLPTSRPSHPINWFLHEGVDKARAQDLDVALLSAVRVALLDSNPLLQIYRDFGNWHPNAADAILELQDPSQAGEIAAVFHLGNSANIDQRSVHVFRSNSVYPSRISVLSPLYEPLQYPVFFTHGTSGWSLSSPWTEAKYYRSLLLREPRFLEFGRLGNEYILDMFSRLMDGRLKFIARGKQAEQDRYLFTEDAGGVENDEPTFSIPSSFLGSDAWCAEQVSDAFALARCRGKPGFFLTATCNPTWPELRSRLRPGQSATEAALITTRVFKARLQKLLEKLKAHFPMDYIVRIIEFQKRGLPHAHIVFRTSPELPFDRIDLIVSAELPTNNPRLLKKVEKYMIHADNHLTRPQSRCKKADGTCQYKYPQPVRPHTTLDEHGKVLYRRRRAEDACVVPYCPIILEWWDGHANFEVVGSIDVFLYLFKYLYKGSDTTAFSVTDPTAANDDNSDPIQDFIRARYTSCCEACWRIFCFDISVKHPSVAVLAVHLPGDNRTQYPQGAAKASLGSTLLHYFYRPLDSIFHDITYCQYYEQFTEHPNPPTPLPPNQYLEALSPHWPQKAVRHRTRGSKVARIHTVRPGHGDVFYLRVLLHNRPARSYEELRTVEGVVYLSFQGAALALGLFSNSAEGVYTMQEAVASFKSPGQLRFLFVLLITEGSNAITLWEQFHHDIDDAFPADSTPFTTNRTLRQIAKLLCESNKTLDDFGLPGFEELSLEVEAELEYFEPMRARLQREADDNVAKMTEEQRGIYDILLDMALSGEAQVDHPYRLSFLSAKAGRGKTFVISTLAAALRAKGLIVIISGSTALAASNYERGRTTHHTYRLTVNDENINIRSQVTAASSRGKFILEGTVHIIDEMPMLNIAPWEAIHHGFQRITGNTTKTWAGRAIIGLGDFRQTAPVVKGGGPTAACLASIKSSALWTEFKLLTLTQPIRNASDPDFADFVDTIGDGWDMRRVDLTPMLKRLSSMDEVLTFLFPPDVLSDPPTSIQRSFLSPLNLYVDEFNTEILSRLPGNARTYTAHDKIKEDDLAEIGLATEDYLSQLTANGVPAHQLHLKVGAIAVIMRNLSIEKGLVKNVRVIIKSCAQRFVEVELVASVGRASPTFCIPRIHFEFKPRFSSFTVIRSQIPLRLAYATTFNSCQGQTLAKVALDQRTEVFAHGQLYTAISRIRAREFGVVLLPEGAIDVANVCYKDLLL